MSEELSICPRQLPHTAPLPVDNPAGADALVARVGTHGAFFNALKRRLSSGEFEQLQRLRARETDDPSIALSDAWSVAADVLTFYNQRLANEAYLRTATERRSLVELAHHVGYRPGPGVAASVYLAFTLEKDPKQAAEETLIPRGTAVKSTPSGDGQPQTFETTDDLTARPEWNALRPRQTMPQEITPGNVHSLDRLYLQGTDASLKPGDRLLVAPDAESIPTPLTVEKVTLDSVNNRTEVLLSESPLSVQKMYREVAGAVDAFLPVAEGVDSQFSWLKSTVVDGLKKLRGDETKDDEENGPLEKVGRLSEFDRRVEAFRTGLTAPENGTLFGAAVPTANGVPEEITNLAPAALNNAISSFLKNPDAPNANAVISDLEPIGVIIQKHVKNVAFARLAMPAVAAAKQFVSVLISLFESARERRRIIGQGAKAIAEDARFEEFKNLKSSPNVAGPWSALQTTLIDTGTEVSESGYPPLNTTFEALKEKKVPFDDLVKEVTDPDLKRLIKALVSELASLAALDGDRSREKEPTERDPNDGAGLGKAASLDRRPPPVGFGSPLVRDAIAALKFPDNSPADVLAQLTGLLGADSPQELRARWKAQTNNGKQTPLAAKLSPPQQLFGHNAPRPLIKDGAIIQIGSDSSPDMNTEWVVKPLDIKGHLFLATETQVVPAPAYVVIQTGGNVEAVKPFRSASTVARSDYGLSAKTTQIDFTDPEYDWTLGTATDKAITPLRKSLASVPVAALPLAERPLTGPIGKDAVPDPQLTGFDPETDQIELDDVVLGIQPGLIVIVQGEHAQQQNVTVTELARVSRVVHIRRDLNGDRVHTRLVFDKPLEHSYKRETVTIFANVVHATQGETVRQTLGGGDASRPFQKFNLARTPLTYLSAPTVTGVASTLEVRVADLKWHERPSLLDSQANSRHYVALADDQHQVTVQFGDGRGGARLPTGRENVRAVYRVGLGAAGNVKANTITQLHHRPLGVKEVDNPLPAAGGADPESIDLIRANAPLAVMALDRLVSVRDYQDFAANYAAIDSAYAQELNRGGQTWVHVTIVGADDIPISDDQINNLKLAYKKYGDASVTVDVQPRTLKLLFFSAQVRLLPDYEWKSVEPKIRRALYDRFGFRRRRLTKPVFRSDAEATVQAVPGVASVSFDIFAGLAEEQLREALNSGTAGQPGTGQPAATGQTPANDSSNKLSDVFRNLRDGRHHVIQVLPPRLDFQNQTAGLPRILPAELAYLSPAVPDSLFLREEVA